MSESDSHSTTPNDQTVSLFAPSSEDVGEIFDRLTAVHAVLAGTLTGELFPEPCILDACAEVLIDTGQIVSLLRAAA